jgi:acyl-CoA hydrolase
MRDLKKIYNSKKSTIEEIINVIKSNDYIITAGNGNAPVTFLRNLHNMKRNNVENIRLHTTSTAHEPYSFMTDLELLGKLTVCPNFYDDLARKNHYNGIPSYIPAHLHNNIERITHDRPCNVFATVVSKMDKHGQFRLPFQVMIEQECLEQADLVIVEVNLNDKIPKTHGEVEIPIDKVDHILEVDTPPWLMHEIKLTDIEMGIGKYIASLIEDGSTIQLGWGGIPNAVAKHLKDKNDLGVHTEMITTSMAELAMEGVITGRKKTLHRGKIIGNFAGGTQLLYDFMDDNPSVWLLRGCYTNNPFIIAQNYKMVSINTGIQVDLSGQVNAESFGAVQYSGVGGISDFSVGSTHSQGGKSIITLRSTAKNETISTINAILTPGSTVSVSRNDVDYIVTEYGIAKMKGRNIAERAEALINIAHPKFRDEIREQAKEYKIIRK